MGLTVSRPQYDEIYKNANQIDRSVATPVCSEVMTVARMYLRLEDLDVSVLKQPEVVKKLILFADVIEMSSTYEISLPGLEHIFIFRVFVINYGHIPHARIRFAYMPSKVITFHQSPTRWFSTAKSLGETNECTLLPQEQELVTSTDGDLVARWKLPDRILFVDATEYPTQYSEDSNVRLAMEATLLISEVILSYMTHVTETVAEATLHVEFLNVMLLERLKSSPTSGSDEVEHHLRTLLFRVQSLLKMSPAGLIVPRLQYDSYSNLINRLADRAHSYDTDFKQLNLFIRQNEVLGTYLLEQNKAFAQKEKDMEEVHSQLHDLKSADLMRVLAGLDRLGEQMSEMSAEMDQAREDMEAGLINFQNRQVARALFSVLNAIAQIGLAIFTGGATAGSAVAASKNAIDQAGAAVSGLQRVFETMEKLLLVVDLLVAMKDLYSSIDDLSEMVEAPGMPEMPSAAEWTIFENEVELVAAGMPEEVSEALTWKAKCKNMAALGRELVTQAELAGQLQYDIQLQSLMQEVARNHAERLEALQPADLTNYQEMAIQLDMRTTRILLRLLKVLSLQNAALLYQYLQAPTPITTNSTSVTMSVVWDLLLKQETIAVISLAELGNSTDREVTYLVKGIPIGLLLEGKDWDFAIPVTDSVDFPQGLNRVRISHLETKFVTAADAGGDEEVHQPTTDTGELYILLRSERLFEDRKRGEHLHYEAMVPVEYQYAYRLDTGETTESNRPSEEFNNIFMRMTPFTRWKLRLSASARENQGLAFPTAHAADATTQIAIHFYFSAIRTIEWRG